MSNSIYVLVSIMVRVEDDNEERVAKKMRFRTVLYGDRSRCFKKSS
jgi:hypothetical protein